MDDFTTSGSSLESARQLLYQAGAKEVHCMAVAKYRNSHAVATVLNQGKWDPYTPTDFDQSQIETHATRGNINKEVDRRFKENIWAYFQNRE